ncbi:MAG: hypothetical protein IPQ08_14165 [Chitinophagaceae bacterium]|nr:hypothetical protein [Chitinophagaceae bacterium]
MKRILSILALTGLLISCNNKKADEKTDGKDTTVTTKETTTEDKTATTVNANGVPSFSDPEVQKFANDYYSFLTEYKAALKDPTKAMELTKTLQEWAGKTTEISMKLANNPEEAKKWADWATVVSQEFANAAKSMYETK